MGTSWDRRSYYEIRDAELSIKKSISARTTGRAKRAVKRALIPGYGKKAMGVDKDSQRAQRGGYRSNTQKAKTIYALTANGIPTLSFYQVSDRFQIKYKPQDL